MEEEGDYEEAERLYKLSSEKGYCVGMYNLGCLYLNGRGGRERERKREREREMEKEKREMEKEREKREGERGGVVEKRESERESKREKEREREREKEGELSFVVDLFERVCGLGYAYGFGALGNRYSLGEVRRKERENERREEREEEREEGERDEEIAAMLYKFGADGMNPIALNRLGDCFLRGNGVPQDLKLSFRYFCYYDIFLFLVFCFCF